MQIVKLIKVGRWARRAMIPSNMYAAAKESDRAFCATSIAVT